MKIPYQNLTPETLDQVISSFILREGTDYGEREWTMEEKKAQVLQAIKSGKSTVVFDQETDSCSILETAPS